MRMNTVDPVILCDRHLILEHSSLHMILGFLGRGYHIRGYISENMISPTKIYARHEEIVTEMLRRKMKHYSPITMEEQEDAIAHLDPMEKDYEIQQDYNLLYVIDHCPDCAARFSQKSSFLDKAKWQVKKILL